MNKKEYIKSIVKGPKESFGTNPKDPWSAKANIAESNLLDRFLKSKGIDPRFVSTDSKISHSKSGEFLKWKRDRFMSGNSFVREAMDGQGGTTERQMRLHKRKKAQDEIPTPTGPGSHNEEVEIDEASSAAQQAAIAISMKKKGIKPKNEEVELEEDHVAIAMGKQLDDEGSMVLNQLDMVERAVRNLRLVIKDPTMQLPAWVQSKITLAADYMDTVAHYMSSRNEDGMNESSYSAKPVDRSPTKRELERKTKPPKSEYERKVEKYLKKKYNKEEVEQIDEAKPLKIKIKDKPPTAAERLYQKHQEIRKKSGLPDPKEYEKKLKEDMYQDTYAATQTVSDGGNTPDDVVMKRERSKSARIIKSMYKKKQMKEDIYDHEKDDKSIETPGKKPKVTKVDKDVGSVSSTPQAFAVMQGGKTMTGQDRDTIEIDPLLRVRPGQVEPTVKKAEKK